MGTGTTHTHTHTQGHTDTLTVRRCGFKHLFVATLTQPEPEPKQFDNVNSNTFLQLAQLVTSRTLMPQEAVFRQGERGRSFFMLLKGSVAVVYSSQVDQALKERLGQ